MSKKKKTKNHRRNYNELTETQSKTNDLSPKARAGQPAKKKNLQMRRRENQRKKTLSQKK